MYHKITIYMFPKLLLLLIVDIFDLFFHNELWHLPDIYILDFSETLSFLLDTPNGKPEILLCIFSPYLQVTF